MAYDNPRPFPINLKQLLLSVEQTLTNQSKEAEVEAKLIIPLLTLCGYDRSDWESQQKIGIKRVDFLIKAQRHSLMRNYLVIEVKAPAKKLDQCAWQIKDYLRKSNSIFGLLTNGKQIQIFYNFNGQINQILDLGIQELMIECKLFAKIILKRNCDLIIHHLDRHELRFHHRLINALQIKYPLELAPHYLPTTSAMIITVFNHKGGVGKTTLTINLAAALGKMGKKVLLIDIDPQANLTTGLGIDPLTDVEEQGKKDIGHLLLEPKTTLEDVIFRRAWHSVKLDVVPSHIRLSDLEPRLIQTIGVDRILARKLHKYKDQYDFILIDPPPSFGRVNSIALMASDAVLIPTQLSAYPIRALEYVINRTFEVDAARDNPIQILGVTISMYSRTATKVKEQMCEEIGRILNKQPETREVEIFPESTWIPQLAVVSTTPIQGMPLCELEFEDQISHSDKEKALDAFSHYELLAQYIAAKH